jgi:putative membrane protein
VSAPPLMSLLWRDWQPAWGPDLAAALTLVFYVGAMRRLRARWPWPRTLSFAAGIACALVAVQSGIDAYDDRLLSDHMIQHLLLLEIAPLLLLSGRPAILLLRAMPRSQRPALAARMTRMRPVTHPVTCLALFTVVLVLWHLPILFDATLRHPLLHDTEHVLFLVAGVFVWLPVLDGDPVPGHRLDGVWRLVYVMAAMLPMTLLGAFLNRDTSLLYAPYAAPARALGISPVVDQQQAGAIMWVLGSSAMIAVGIWQAMAALAAEERRHQGRERRAAPALLDDPGREA